jgi:dolichol-phosphate mannosyltransferase
MEKESDYSHISLSLIIPVYNEEEAILSALESNIQALNTYLTKYEIIIVNDGSRDKSQSIIMDYVKGKDHITIVDKSRNEGLGSAIRTGIKMSTYDYILPVPVDCPLDEDALRRFLSHLEDHDIVIGYRPVRVGYSLRMRINSFVFQKLIKNLFKVDLKDYNWIHLYKRKIFTEDGIQITSRGIVMLAEVLIKSIRKGLSVNEVEILQRERLTGVATASKITTVIKTIKEIAVLYRRIG